MVNIKTGDRAVKELQEQKVFGTCGYTDRERYFIKADSTVGSRKFNETVCHEFFEAINTIYLDNELRHRHITAMARGFHQILEQLKVRFVK